MSNIVKLVVNLLAIVLAIGILIRTWEDFVNVYLRIIERNYFRKECMHQDDSHEIIILCNFMAL